MKDSNSADCLRQENRNEQVFFNNWFKIKERLKAEVFMVISVD